MRAENALIWSEYDDSDFALTTAHFGGAAWGGRSVTALKDYRYNVACQVVAINQDTGNLTVVAWSDGTDNYHEYELIKDLIDMKGQKRDQFEMAGDCLGAAFLHWQSASQGERLGLSEQMVADLLDELTKAIAMAREKQIAEVTKALE